ncbi:NAD(P)/FAD-dependent oxidoreductase [Calidithermus roseus]|uniref:tRNA 5-methylaminomethyl-2-thiouridine biosynthesis bifunctional protein MnmC n=1 Tax=Calidithermus roseus TaxID=1644118 RepID=A0A399ES63_9DEIN|nr:FAD-dependent oxidoreductase [Calidithermus roseus]RIH85031.1 tRNA 5-methylaminomethyl-2-thiouridine biosynthesis bifunctional protein MnmC [Calidithermus roseus]
MSKLEAEVVICGAGIAGIAVAYELAVKRGVKNVVLLEQDAPLSLTSDKSTECYRNWWPGPDGAMIALMNRSIERLEHIARESNNRIGLGRRGYLYATAEAGKVLELARAAENAARMGAGPLRVHEGKGESYAPAPAHGFEGQPDGADLITDKALIRRHFPYLAEDTVAVLHARRAGWFSAQQLGMWMLEQSRAHGVRLVQGRVTGVQTTAGRVNAVEAERADGSAFSVRTPCFVNAAGPMQKAVGRMLGVELPVFAELHLKMSFAEHLGVVPREAPMLIWMDEVRLPWSPEEQEMLAEEPSTRWLLGTFPSGVHCRPDGHGESNTLIVLYNYHLEPLEPRFPLPSDPHYADVALRGMSVMVPGLRRYFDRAPKPYIDGGYYVKTRENRPLIGPLGVKGAYVVGALSGFGVMAACAAGELLAAHILGDPLPEYAPAFALERYEDPEYRRRLEQFGDGAQL